MNFDEAQEVLRELNEIYPDWEPAEAELRIRVRKITKYSGFVWKEAMNRYMDLAESDYKKPRFNKILKLCGKVQAEEAKDNRLDNRPRTIFLMECMKGEKEGQVTRFAINKLGLLPDVEVIRKYAERWVKRLKGLYHDSEWAYILIDQSEVSDSEEIQEYLPLEERRRIDEEILSGGDCPGKRFLLRLQKKRGVRAKMDELKEEAVKSVGEGFEKDYDEEVPF